MNAPLRSVVLGTILFCAGGLPASARLLEYQVDGYFVMTGPYSWGPFAARLTTVFDTATRPTKFTRNSATYEALYATVTYLQGERDGESEYVYGVTLRVARQPEFGSYGYTFSGVTEAGWQVWSAEHASDPAFVPDLRLPTRDPIQYLAQPDVMVRGDLEIVAAAEGWSAYTDNGAFFDIDVLPVRRGAPVILRQPSLGHGGMSQALKLSVRVRSASPVTYQWLKDGLPLPGETSADLRIERPSRDDAGVYRVLVRNEVGITISKTVVVGASCHPSWTSVRWRH